MIFVYCIDNMAKMPYTEIRKYKGGIERGNLVSNFMKRKMEQSLLKNFYFHKI